MPSSDDILARAEAALERHGGVSRMTQRAAKRKLGDAKRRFLRMVGFGVGLAIAVPFWGLFIGPVGIGGILVAAMVFILGCLMLAIFPRAERAAAETLPQTELARLPLKTESWLATQRKSLPPPAQRLVDGIGVKLEMLSGQLGALDEREPAAAEVRRLIGTDLPELVNGYTRVPPHLRREAANGSSPDAQLVEGLNLVDSELARMSTQIASGDLNQLATQARYLEIKYQGDDA
jgi:hypothetical protein